MSEIVCVHWWSVWFEPMGDGPKWRICRGLCKRTQNDGDPDPEVVIARFL